VDILLKSGADVTQVTNKGNTPLHTTTSKGSRETIDILLQYVSHNKLNDFINAKTTSGGTMSLHVAAKNGFLEIVKSLLKHGPDDGWKYCPKHVEEFPDINKLCNIASCWICIGILSGVHPILHISRIRVK
jgi:ankyrin repeat protein